MTKSTKC